MDKEYKLQANELRDMEIRIGACLASDRIPVDGERIGFMYREEPDNKHDSGWRFFAGDESPEYLKESKNMAFYDVNTIANYDPTIMPYLDRAAPVAFERNNGEAQFREITPPPDQES